VSSFATEMAAKAWISREKQRVKSESLSGRWSQKIR